MNPQEYNNESVPLKLPEVQVEPTKSNLEAPRSLNADENSISQAIEQGALNSGSFQPPTLPMPGSPSDPIINSSIKTNDRTQPRKIPVVTADLLASDTDRIEKAWVEKAKAIVAQTKDDPYLQSNELTKIKEDYQYKRFNTKLKISE